MCCFQAHGHCLVKKVKREAKSKAVSRDGNEGGGEPGFLMTLKMKAEQAIKMKNGGGKDGGRNKGRIAVSMLTFPEKGKKKLL